MRVCLLVQTKEVEKVKSDNSLFLRRSWNDTLKLIVVASQNGYVPFELWDVFPLDRDERRIFINFPHDDTLLWVAHLTRRNVLKLSHLDLKLFNRLAALIQRLR